MNQHNLLAFRTEIIHEYQRLYQQFWQDYQNQVLEHAAKALAATEDDISIWQYQQALKKIVA